MNRCDGCAYKGGEDCPFVVDPGWNGFCPNGRLPSAYTADATMSDGKHLSITGTIIKCADWADKVIRENDGNIMINIVKI